MHELKLLSESKRRLKPLVESALKNELRLIEAGIRQTQHRLDGFETKFQMKTHDFITSYENDKLEESMEYMEWVGESRLLERLNEKADTLRNIRFAS